MEEADGVTQFVHDGAPEETTVTQGDLLFTLIDHTYVGVAPEMRENEASEKSFLFRFQLQNESTIKVTTLIDFKATSNFIQAFSLTFLFLVQVCIIRDEY